MLKRIVITIIAGVLLLDIVLACSANQAPDQITTQASRQVLEKVSSQTAGQVRHVDWTDFIKWNDRIYNGAWPGTARLVPEDLIEEKLGEVTETAPSEVYDDYVPENGTAGYLKPGTAFFCIRGFSVDAYIAMEVDGRYRLYKTRDSETPDFPVDDMPLYERGPEAITHMEEASVDKVFPIEQSMNNKADRSPEGLSMRIVEISEMIEIPMPTQPPAEGEEVPHFELDPSEEFITLDFNLPDGFQMISTMNSGDESLYRFLKEGIEIRINVRYTYTLADRGSSVESALEGLNQMEINGQTVYFRVFGDSVEYGAINFEKEGLFFNVSGPMEDIITLSEALLL